MILSLEHLKYKFDGNDYRPCLCEQGSSAAVVTSTVILVQQQQECIRYLSVCDYYKFYDLQILVGNYLVIMEDYNCHLVT